jgi:hypothetical protein
MSEYQESAAEVPKQEKRWDDVFEEANKRWRYVNDVDADNRRDARDDTRFVWVRGAQWPDNERLAREADGRPALEINQLPQFIHQVVNDQRQNRPAIKIRPDSDDASKEIADIYEGLTRDIEYVSKAPAIYDKGFEHAVTGGRGYWRVCTEYESDQSFNQRIVLRGIPDPLMVYLDPDYQQPDASDIEWGYVAEAMTHTDFKRQYPDAQPLDFEGMDSAVIAAKWAEGEDKVIVADYFRKTYTSRTLVQLSTGALNWKDALGERDPALPGAPKDYPETYAGARILAERESQTCKVEWFKVYGGGVLEEYEWAGKYIPIVMCIGDETVIDGKRLFQGLIRRARDVQTMFNFWQTKATESLALAPMAQWLIPDDAVEGYEQIWDEANLRLRTRLPYKSSANMPPPQRIEAPQAQSGVLEQANQCRQDFYTTIGIYPPSLGEQGKEIAGIAIRYRQQQGDRGTFHFVDNLSRAIEHTGRVVVDLIPHIYDTQRPVNSLDADGKQKSVVVNQKNPLTGQVLNNLAAGEYAVAVDVGPSYATKRMEAAQSMMEFIGAYPEAGPLIGDMIAKNQDWADADKITARLQVMLPPQIQMLEAQSGGDPKVAALATALKSQQQQAQQQVQQLMQQLQIAGQQMTDMKAKLAQVQLAAANKALSATVAAHNSDMRANAETQRTQIEGYGADTDRLGVILDFIADLAKLQQTQTAPIGPEANALEQQTRPAVMGANAQ